MTVCHIMLFVKKRGKFMRKIIVVVLSLFVLVSCGEHNLMDNSSNIYDSPNENLQNEEINKEANTAEHNFFYVTPCG